MTCTPLSHLIDDLDGTKGTVIASVCRTITSFDAIPVTACRVISLLRMSFFALEALG